MLIDNSKYENHSYAAATGRYAGRKAAVYAKEAKEPLIYREQVAREIGRVYATVKGSSCMD